MSFALNHTVAPSLDHGAFFDLAAKLGVREVEIRNDLAHVAILDGTPASAIGKAARIRGLSIISINALQRFNEWSDGRAAEASELAEFARACGAGALVLCPVNDEAFDPGEGERLAGLRQALAGLKPILERAGIAGLVEPLGFAECSLRLKAEAVEAIDAVGGGAVFRLVHDTFHHHVAGERAMFPERTGLVHVSGVTDRSVAVAAMRDPHRVLIDESDLIDNVGQLERLVGAGYRGPVSFEPFSPEVARSSDIAGDVARSMDFIAGRLQRFAAE
jgi:2-keto-myo-inositol isomerase